MVDIAKKEVKFKYSAQKEGELKYNLLNGFKDKSSLIQTDLETQELLSKLELAPSYAM